MIHFGTYTVASYIRVQWEGEIQGSGVLRHGFELSFRGEDKDFRGE